MQSSLETATTELEAKLSAISELEQAKVDAEEEVAKLQKNLDEFEALRADDVSKLESVHQEV